MTSYSSPPIPDDVISKEGFQDRLHELDSYEEFVGFMELSPEMRIQMMPLLENRHARHSIKRYLGIIGAYTKAGLTELKKHLKNGWTVYKAWDAGYAPKVEEAKRRLAEPRSKSKRKVTLQSCYL